MHYSTNEISRVIFQILTLSIMFILPTESSQEEVTIERISDERGIINESPFWDDDIQALYWLDIRGNTVYKYDGRNVTSVLLCEGLFSGIIPVAKNPDYFIIGIGNELNLMYWDGIGPTHRLKPVASVDKDKPGNRFNDGKCDSKGRLWIGTMGQQNFTDGAVVPMQGSLFMVSAPNYDPLVKITPVSVSNGLTWSNDNTKFYYIDSLTRAIFSYDYNAVSGDIANQKVLFDLNTSNIDGLPDGMTIDTNGNLWVAIYNGGVVIKVDSKTGKLLNQYKLPAAQVSSVVWGGPNYGTLYVTTGSQFLSDEELREQEGAGHVFAVKNLGEKGSKSVKFCAKETLCF